VQKPARRSRGSPADASAETILRTWLHPSFREDSRLLSLDENPPRRLTPIRSVNGILSTGCSRPSLDRRLSGRDQRPWRLDRPAPEGRAGLLPAKSRHAMVGGAGLVRRPVHAGLE